MCGSAVETRLLKRTKFIRPSETAVLSIFNFTRYYQMKKDFWLGSRYRNYRFLVFSTVMIYFKNQTALKYLNYQELNPRK